MPMQCLDDFKQKASRIWLATEGVSLRRVGHYLCVFRFVGFNDRYRIVIAYLGKYSTSP